MVQPPASGGTYREGGIGRGARESAVFGAFHPYYRQPALFPWRLCGDVPARLESGKLYSADDGRGDRGLLFPHQIPFQILPPDQGKERSGDGQDHGLRAGHAHHPGAEPAEKGFRGPQGRLHRQIQAGNPHLLHRIRFPEPFHAYLRGVAAGGYHQAHRAADHRRDGDSGHPDRVCGLLLPDDLAADADFRERDADPAGFCELETHSGTNQPEIRGRAFHRDQAALIRA